MYLTEENKTVITKTFWYGQNNYDTFYFGKDIVEYKRSSTHTLTTDMDGLEEQIQDCMLTNRIADNVVKIYVLHKLGNRKHYDTVLASFKFNIDTKEIFGIEKNNDTLT